MPRGALSALGRLLATRIAVQCPDIFQGHEGKAAACGAGVAGVDRIRLSHGIGNRRTGRRAAGFSLLGFRVFARWPAAVQDNEVIGHLPA